MLEPVLRVVQSYLGLEKTPRVGGQHALNQDYFRRIDALNFALVHDDGQLPDDVNEADILLLGISRTSKTPTSIYLANRGVRVANVPIVPDIPLPPQLDDIDPENGPLIVGLIASPDRIVQIRQNRLLSLNAADNTDYVDRDAVATEVARTRKLCGRRGWPTIDVTRRSIEENRGRHPGTVERTAASTSARRDHEPASSWHRAATARATILRDARCRRRNRPGGSRRTSDDRRHARQ